MATSSVSKRKAAQQSGKQKFDLVIGGYSFKLQHPDHGLWKATIAGVLPGEPDSYVRYPDGVIVHLSSRKSMLDYLRYAYGAEKKPSTKKVTGEACAGTTLVEAPEIELDTATGKPAFVSIAEEITIEEAKRRFPCPAASDTRVPGCAGYMDTAGFHEVAPEPNEPRIQTTRFPDHGDDIAKAVEAQTTEENDVLDRIIAIAQKPSYDSSPTPLVRFHQELTARLFAPVIAALDFTPSGPDVRDQIVSHIQDLRKQYETINAFNDQQAKTIREADAELREKDVEIAASRRVIAHACTDLVNVRANNVILTGANEEQREKIAQLESDLDYTIKANLRLDSLAKYSGKMVSELWNQNRQISDSLARHKYYVDHACTQNEKLWMENDDLRDEVAKAQLANTCTMLAQYPLGFWGRVWKAVRNA